MADWQKIKTEYITTDTSYRKLAQKYGVNYRTICVRSKQEGWIEQREQHINKTTTKTLDAISDKQVDRATKLISVADLLLDRVKQLVESGDLTALDTQGMKHISGVLKDIKEVQMVRSEKDLEEQDARIAKLRKEAEKEERGDNTIVVQFAEGSEEYAR